MVAEEEGSRKRGRKSEVGKEVRSGEGGQKRERKTEVGKEDGSGRSRTKFKVYNVTSILSISVYQRQSAANEETVSGEGKEDGRGE